MKKIFEEPVIAVIKLQETEAITDDEVEIGPNLSTEEGWEWD